MRIIGLYLLQVKRKYPQLTVNSGVYPQVLGTKVLWQEGSLLEQEHGPIIRAPVPWL